MYRATFAMVDLQAFAHNLQVIHNKLSTGTRLMVAVKANAYGHGIEPMMRVIAASKVSAVAVATLEEAIAIRQFGYSLPILIFGALGREELPIAAAHGVDVTYTDTWGDIQSIPALASLLKVHLAIDTGMNRMGMKSVDGVRDVVMRLRNRRDIKWVGTYTHLATADAQSDDLAQRQVARFNEIMTRLRSDGQEVPNLYHTANSAAVLRNPTWHFDMVRIGIAAYGYSPDEDVLPSPQLRPVMHVYSQVTRVTTVNPGEHIGYGATFTATRPMRVATIAIGYADGIMRILSNRGLVLVRGHVVPIVGRVCMDQLMIDVSEVEKIQIGDFVTLFGREAPASLTGELWWRCAPEARADLLRQVFRSSDDSNQCELPLWRIATLAETIPYEVVCQISSRVPRVYFD